MKKVVESTSISDTKQQILDVAERHFAVYGYAGTSLRAIIKDASVNVAAVAYHFGTKEELFKAVLERFAAPVVQEQLRQLALSEKRKSLKAILECFYLPPLRLVKARGKSGSTLALFLGRVQTEGEPVFSMVETQFAGCRQRFIEALQLCLPKSSEAELQWKFEFMLSLIVCFLTRQREIRRRYGDSSDWTPEVAADEMISFCLQGMRAK